MHPLTTQPNCASGPVHTAWLARATCRHAMLSPVLLFATPGAIYRDALLDAWSETFPDDPLLDFDSGNEVLQFLWNPIAIKPRLLVLDAHTAEPSALSILHSVRHNPVLSHLPIAILASKSNREAIEAAYAMRANWCFQAPMDRDAALHLLTGTPCPIPDAPEKTAVMAA